MGWIKSVVHCPLSVVLLIVVSALFFSSAHPQSPATSDTYREAYDAGYEDGLPAGRQDKEQNRLFDLANKKAFQLAERGFNPARHDRDVYVVAYRRGFEDGYEEGYGLTSKNPGYAAPPVLPPSSAPGTAAAPRSAPSSIRGRTAQLPAGTEFKVRLIDTLSTRRNDRGDSFRAEVVEDVQLAGNVIIPKGTRILGTIGHLKRAGRIAGRAEMSLQFEEFQWPDGSKSALQATVVGIESRAAQKVKDGEGTLQGEGAKSEDMKRVGTSASMGGIIGLITGGKKGGAVAAAAGAVVGLANVLSTRGRDIDLYSHTELTIRLSKEAQVPAP